MKTIEVVAAVIKRDGKYLIGKRPLEKRLGGLWEFPGGGVEEGETHKQCLYREIEQEEFPGMKISVDSFLGEGTHKEDDLEINLSGYRARYIRGIFQIKAHLEIAWVFAKEFRNYKFAPADLALIEKIKQ